MQILTILLFMMTSLLVSAELSHISIGNKDFSLTTESYKIYDSKGTIMRLYSEERNNNLRFVLKLTLHDTTGPCSSKSVEEGAYEIEGKQIMLYTSWIRRGKAYDAPQGARIEIFELQPDHTLALISSKIYIETAHQKYHENSGMRFLFKKPENEQEETLFERYISNVERKYHSTFVFGKEAQKLRSDVEKALQRKLQNKWH